MKKQTSAVLEQAGFLTEEQSQRFIDSIIDDSTLIEPSIHNGDFDSGNICTGGQGCETRPCPNCGDHYGACIDFVEGICENCTREL